jgi:syntaxin 8
MSNPSQLFLLADHIKLSLLERQRAISLKLDPTPTQSSRSLESFREGLEVLEKSPQSNTSDVDQLQRLRSQYNDLSRQFYGDGLPSTAEATVTSPNDPALAADFDRAQQTGRGPARSSSLKREASKASKSVRFRDNEEEEDLDPNRNALFPTKYTDDPGLQEPDLTEAMSNEQIHAYHSQVMAEQDEHLDRLGESIGRQRHISMQIGDELEGQVALLDEENWGMTIIIVLIVILVLLIAILK